MFDFFRHFLRLGSLSLLGSLITSLFGPLFELLGVPVMLAFIPSALVGMGLVFTVPLVLGAVFPRLRPFWSPQALCPGWPSIVLLHGSCWHSSSWRSSPWGWDLSGWRRSASTVGILCQDLCGVAVEVTEVCQWQQRAGPDHFNA